VFVSKIEAVAVALFAAGLILGIIPPLLLLALTAIITHFAINVFHSCKLLRWMFLVLLISQSVILFAWMEGWTAASAFEKHSYEIGLPIIDPKLEHALMIAFWLIAALVVAIAIEHLLNSHFKVGASSFGKHAHKKQMLVLVFEMFLLMAVSSSIVNFRRMPSGVNVPSSLSSDGTKEIQLVPMNAWIDTNGLVIARRPNSLIWRTVGEIGDTLTGADSGRFVWLNDSSKVYLLLNFNEEKDRPVLGFDFETNKEIDLKSYVEQK
jgi:hypothetical protein